MSWLTQLDSSFRGATSRLRYLRAFDGARNGADIDPFHTSERLVRIDRAPHHGSFRACGGRSDPLDHVDRLRRWGPDSREVHVRGRRCVAAARVVRRARGRSQPRADRRGSGCAGSRRSEEDLGPLGALRPAAGELGLVAGGGPVGASARHPRRAQRLAAHGLWRTLSTHRTTPLLLQALRAGHPAARPRPADAGRIWNGRCRDTFWRRPRSSGPISGRAESRADATTALAPSARRPPPRSGTGAWRS